MRLLLVDDDPDIFDGLMRALVMRGGFDLTSAPNGAVAIKFLHKRGREFDCVVTDYQMPYRIGLDVAAECAKLKIPCVLLRRSFKRR